MDTPKNRSESLVCNAPICRPSACKALGENIIACLCLSFCCPAEDPDHLWWRCVVFALLNDLPSSGGPSLYQYSLLITSSCSRINVLNFGWITASLAPSCWRHLDRPNVVMATPLLSLQVWETTRFSGLNAILPEERDCFSASCPRVNDDHWLAARNADDRQAQEIPPRITRRNFFHLSARSVDAGRDLVMLTLRPLPGYDPALQRPRPPLFAQIYSGRRS